MTGERQLGGVGTAATAVSSEAPRRHRAASSEECRFSASAAALAKGRKAVRVECESSEPILDLGESIRRGDADAANLSFVPNELEDPEREEAAVGEVAKRLVEVGEFAVGKDENTFQKKTILWQRMVNRKKYVPSASMIWIR